MMSHKQVKLMFGHWRKKFKMIIGLIFLTFLYFQLISTAPIEKRENAKNDYCSRLSRAGVKNNLGKEQQEEPSRYGIKSSTHQVSNSKPGKLMDESEKQLIRKIRDSEFDLFGGSLQFPAAGDIRVEEEIKNCQNSVASYDRKIVEDNSIVKTTSDLVRLLSDEKYKRSEVNQNLSVIFITMPANTGLG
ncbi:uncharacterized protein LOC141858554 [Brevipalpus obovatus]|uniref:uncharacterized protein LOC141858554 n=1 Tax=Brevipalpus obovatus TaxID=246614 RepID=UPI003D9E5B4A